MPECELLQVARRHADMFRTWVIALLCIAVALFVVLLLAPNLLHH
jgi:hypothetical protein